VPGRIPFRVPLPVEREGFQRLELRLTPPCPPDLLPELNCRTLTVENARLARGSDQFLRPQIPYEGMTLVASSLSRSADVLTVRLLWDFDTDISEETVRFVHVQQPGGGAPLAQADGSLGAHRAGSQRLESFTISLRDLPPGEYSVRVGWYHFPSLERLRVLDAAIPGAVDGAPEIDTIRVD